MEVFNIKNNKLEVVELNPLELETDTDLDYMMFLINKKVKNM
jgi:hypothetical protein